MLPAGMQRYSVASGDTIKVDWHHESSRLLCNASTFKIVKTCAFAAVALTMAVTFLVFFVDVLASIGAK
jgi:hypothetical protein